MALCLLVYIMNVLGTTAFISDLSVFERECIKNKCSKYRGSLVSSEMGGLEKRSERKEDVTEPCARVMSSICVMCYKPKELYGGAASSLPHFCS